MIAEEDCALGEHETRNIVCCAKHHLEVPCASCAELENKNKELENKNKESENKNKEALEKKEKDEEMAEG